MDTRVCTKCNTEMPLDRFRKRSRCIGGFSRQCMTCEKSSHKEWYNKNKERVLLKNKESYLKDPAKRKASVKKYKSKNKDKIREANRVWARNNPEKIKQKNRRKYIKHKDKLLIKGREWKSKNPEYVKDYTKKRSQKDRDLLDTHYLITLISREYNLERNLIKGLPKIIDLKRNQIQSKRLIKQKEHGK